MKKLRLLKKKRLTEEIEPEEDLENMLSQSLKQDADAFWEAAPDVNVKSNQNTLTFEEARQRGLAPARKDNREQLVVNNKTPVRY